MRKHVIFVAVATKLIHLQIAHIWLIKILRFSILCGISVPKKGFEQNKYKEMCILKLKSIEKHSKPSLAGTESENNRTVKCCDENYFTKASETLTT